jgi:hypothetical protein
MTQSTRFLYQCQRSLKDKPTHTIQAFGPAVKCASKKEALELEKKLNQILRQHDEKRVQKQ